MNIHPIFVHFPIALLALYSILELVRSKRVIQKTEFFYIKFFLLLVGVLGAFSALWTGDDAEKLHRDARALVNTHSFFAEITTIFFCILLSIYIFTWIDMVYLEKISRSRYSNIWQKIKLIKEKIAKVPLIMILSTLGLISLLVTGALGGAIVYGTAGDPLTAFIYKIFFP